LGRLKSCCNNGAIKSHYLLAVKMLGTTQKGLTLVAKLVPKGGMRSLSLSRVPSAVGAFLAKFSSRRLVAGLALVVAMGSADGVRAGPQPAPANISVVNLHPTTPNTVRVSFLPVAGFTNETPDSVYNKYGVLYGGDFVNLSALSLVQNSGVSLFSGSIISISANVKLESFSKDITGGLQSFDLEAEPPSNANFATTVTDLAIYVGGAYYPATSPGSLPSPVPIIPSLNTVSDSPVQFFGGAGTLQVGGTNGTGAGVSLLWHPSFPDESLSVTKNLQSFGVTAGSGVSEQVWLGNAYTEGDSFGRWSGYIDFTFASSSGGGVPDASRTALLLAPGTLLLLGLAGRARRRG
jgi:hypothetical protein